MNLDVLYIAANTTHTKKKELRKSKNWFGRVMQNLYVKKGL